MLLQSNPQVVEMMFGGNLAYQKQMEKMEKMEEIRVIINPALSVSMCAININNFHPHYHCSKCGEYKWYKRYHGSIKMLVLSILMYK